MSKMSYSSASEGEIVESDEAETKATTTQPSSRDSAIDRRNRPRSPQTRSPRPPHSQLDGAHDDDYASGLDYANDRRSRATHQAATTRPPHGHKRRHEEDGYHDRDRTDTRRFKVHYESRRDGRDDQSRHAQGQGTSRPSMSGRYHDNEGRGHYDDARSRDRHTRSRRSSSHSTADRESTPVHLRQEGRAAGRHRSFLQEDAPTTGIGASSTQEKAEVHAGDTVLEDAAPQPVVDEAKLIEDRRKRREALRAKHKIQETPLLQQALHLNIASQPSTPRPDVDTPDDHLEISTTEASPRTPRSPGSPAMFSVTDDIQLANPMQHQQPGTPTTAEASAADYDPSMDAEEATVRKQHSVQANEMGAAIYDETKDGDRAVVLPKTSIEQLQAPKSKEFDMFADDDDDDMFAPEEQTKGHRKDDGTQAVRIPEAKQLDRSMLDDWDDPEGYYRIILGELLDNRYHVQTNLGKGVFSAVVRALDTTINMPVAIKIIRMQESMYKAGIKEIEILQKLTEADPEDKKHIIRLERHFEHKGHLCMVFESLSINLREVLKKFGRDVGINIKAVRSYAQQMFFGLSLLKKCEILHADLKPDNVLVNESRSQLKIADLGSAMDVSDNEVTDVLVSRFYRAPEIMLGIRHDYAIDMWSIGCTLFELYTGKICFTGPTNNQMLKGIMECRGKIPNRMLKKSEFWAQHFEPDGTFISQEVDTITRKDVVRKLNITRTIPAKELRTRLFANAKGLSPLDAKELNLFADLLDKCLAVDPARRITPTEALKHGFINRSVVVNGAKP